MARGLLDELKAAGQAGLEPKKLKVAGVRKEPGTLVRTGLAISLDGSIYYDGETYRSLVRSLLAGLPVGAELKLAEAKARSSLSRKYLLPLLNRMEADGLVKREGDLRRVRRQPE